MPKLRRQLLQKKKSGQPILGVMTGSGQVAKYSVQAGADLIFSINAGMYRDMGLGSLASFLPYGNANAQTESLVRHQFTSYSSKTPLVAGIFASDPTQPQETRIERLRNMGVRGITNWPAIGFIDGLLNAALKANGIDTYGELEMLTLASQMNMATFGFVLNEEQAAVFAESGVHCLVLNMGLTKELEDVKERKDQLQLNMQQLRKMLKAVEDTGKETICLAFGGVATQMEDLEILLRNCPVDGFAGGSVFDRFPIQGSVTAAVRQFKSAFTRPKGRGVEEGLGDMLGASSPMKNLFTIIKKVAPHDVNVCIEGESGTGKELVANQIHNLSQRASHPFVTLNCGAIPDSLLESELFGHEKGSFTGADRRRLGKFELAHEGTLFLDEIADLSPHGQVALLRAIQQREITRIGGERPISVDVRILAASNKSLIKLVEKGKFRADLYYRLNSVTIDIPPLRNRIEDLPILIQGLLLRLEPKLNKKINGVSSHFLKKLSGHYWPGNIRELDHVLCESAIMESGSLLEGNFFHPREYVNQDAGSIHSPLPSQESRREAAIQAVEKAKGNKTEAARLLNVTRKTLYSWLEMESQN